jgi:prevent-host-death family protein
MRPSPVNELQSVAARIARADPERAVAPYETSIADRVAREHDHFTITRNGRADVMLISVAEYESMQETLDILSDDETLADLRQSRDDYTVIFSRQARRNPHENLPSTPPPPWRQSTGCSTCRSLNPPWVMAAVRYLDSW